MVNRSATWADWDEGSLRWSLQDLNDADFDLSLDRFDPKEIDDLLLVPEDDEAANAVPPVPAESGFSRQANSGLCGRIAYYVAMPPARKRWRGCSATEAGPLW